MRDAPEFDGFKPVRFAGLVLSVDAYTLPAIPVKRSLSRVASSPS
jgi:hypothetical protein